MSWVRRLLSEKSANDVINLPSFIVERAEDALGLEDPTYFSKTKVFDNSEILSTPTQKAAFARTERPSTPIIYSISSNNTVNSDRLSVVTSSSSTAFATSKISSTAVFSDSAKTFGTSEGFSTTVSSYSTKTFESSDRLQTASSGPITDASSDGRKGIDVAVVRSANASTFEPSKNLATHAVAARSVPSLFSSLRPSSQEFVALTTFKNFHYDLDNVLECEWVIIGREELETPRFQNTLGSSTQLNKHLSGQTRQRKRAHRCQKVTWTPPQTLEDTCEVPKKESLWRRVLRRIGTFWTNFFSKMKRQYKVIEDELFDPDAAGRVRALRGCRGSRGAGAALRAYALHLAQDKSTTFAQNVDHFIQCTLDSKEICPQVVMRNMRQFMSGMKNYLVKHGEREFEKEVEKERMKLKSTEFLNLDAILETVMHRLVVRPLRSRLYTLLADWHAADVRALHAAIQHAADATPLQMGIKASTTIPSVAVLATISRHFLRMQESDSPLDKLENLLAAISAIFNSIRGERALGADDLLPMLAWVVARCRLVCAELEAELMAGLLPPALLAGEGGYYLTALFSAVAVLKRMAPDRQQDAATLWRRSSLESSSSAGQACVVRVALPDECRGSIRRVALPCRPGARARDLCRALAHQAAITNPQDYALFALHNGQETMLSENDCPQEVMSEKNKNCILAYKRIDAKIAWPKQALMSLP